MHVLAFGTYQRDYPRNRQVRSCLARAGITVSERHADVWDGRRDAWSAGPRSALRLALAEARLAASHRTGADAVLVGYPGHLDLRAARRAAGDAPVVFDPLVSLYDTFVGDRARFAPGSLAARALAAIDRAAFRAADLVIADTAAHAAFYAGRFDLPEPGLRVCRVGAEDDLFRPLPRDPLPPEPPGRAARFEALFVGKLIPLHGLETILAAARMAPEVQITIVGSGQLAPQLAATPTNVRHVPWVEYDLLPQELAGAGCALGIFGTSEKAQRVVPNKAYQALACGTPLVTGDTPAARELLTDGEDALLVPPGDPEALASALRRLAADPGLAARLGAAGRATYEREASEVVLGARWSAALQDVLGRRA